MLFLSIGLLAGVASAINLKVSSSGGNASSPLAYGLMFEDINHSGDGGIYAELIQNRAFQGSTEFPSTLEPWVAVGNAVLSLQTTTPLSSALPTSVNVASNGTGKVGLLNPGWWGIDVKPQPYKGSFWVLGSYSGFFTAKLQSNLTSEVFATATIPSRSQPGKWVEHNFELFPRSAAPNSNNTFVIEFDGGHSLNFNLISLFPPTYKNRPNGNRADLMAALKALNPSFLRMPGGNNIEGQSVSQYAWKWNNTIGPLTQRPGRPGTWGYENTDGLGLVEYLHWCDDLEVEPILAVWDGLYLNGYVTPPDVIPESEIDIYVQDALDELEFITGPVTSPYGSLRASLGYPDPWKINYVEIGNEDQLGGAEVSYVAYRFAAFYNAISAKYPNITILSSTGDTEAQVGNSATDFHEYSRPDLFVSQFGYWDNVVDKDHLTLIGEYAVIQVNKPTVVPVDWSGDETMIPYPSWVGAVSEAIFSFGAERNSYGIIGMSYAPGFQNLNSYEWAPDLISFTADPAQDVLSTSYHVIELLSNFRYDATVPVTSDTEFGPAYWVAGTSGPGKYTFKAATYNSTEPTPFNISFEGLRPNAKGTLTVLTAPDGLSANVLDGNEVVSKNVTKLVAGKDGAFVFELENYSVAVLTT